MSASFNDQLMRFVPSVFNCKKMSNREHQVAELIAKGMSNKEAADVLCVAEKTIKFHLTSVYKKLNVKTRAQLCVLAAKHKAGEAVIVAGLGVGLDIK